MKGEKGLTLSHARSIIELRIVGMLFIAITSMDK